MKSWNERTREVAYLLNPAFCGRLLYAAIKEYIHKTQLDFPFPLVYLILPLVLHKQTRITINSRTQLLLWTKNYQHLLIGFARRTKELVVITNEALELLLQSETVQITTTGKLSITAAQKSLSKTRFVNSEISECIQKSEHVARWFANTGRIETIYISLGVRP
ncbi:three component ABC system middle component [Mailhella massiliensis]|uniref:three component ABC system middle component n=1 Tax=Mailhella massiliensis TaxID=1903261 RepID=UPI00097D3792|nr:three component ABC system middle component [Mailhella massiliensis]